MSKTISPVNVATDTFQVWVQRTNDIISELGTSIVTASLSGDTTVGSSTLSGTLTANTVVGTNLMRTNTIDTKVGNSSPLEVRSQSKFTSTEQISVSLDNSVGPRVRVKNNNIAWHMGLRGSAGTGTDAQFIVGVEGSNYALRLGTDGIVYANTVILDTSSSSSFSAVRSDRTISANNGIVGGGDLTSDRTLGLTGNALSLHNMASTGMIVRTGSNTLTTRTIANGTGISITNGTGVSGNPTISIDSTVVVLSGSQTITGSKTFSLNTTFSSGINVTGAGINVTGDSTFNSNIGLPSGVILAFNGDRLKLYGDATNARIAAATHMNIDMTENGNLYVRDNAAANKFTLNTTSGDFTALGNVTAYSDERLKTNIRTIDNALDRVTEMRGVFFDKGGRPSTGVIAQEIERVLPEVVLEGEYKSVAYGNVIGVLIEAIKELKSEIEDLKRDR